MDRRRRIELPPFAESYLGSHRNARHVVRQFHLWLKGTHRPLLQLDPTELEPFVDSLARAPVTQRTRAVHRRQLLHYLDWLHAQRLLPFDSKLVWSRRCPLPATADAFLVSLQPTLRPSTIRCYQSNLRSFHLWLQRHDWTPGVLDRSRISGWLAWLHRRNLHPSTRTHAILNVRAYLRWLDEQRLLGTPADVLIRSNDLPKLPDYLPRPLPPDADAELQRRLQASHSVYALALLLMRRTGLRIGELRSLPRRCVQNDRRGNQFLKVPLGKLANERLVPIDGRTAKLLRKLQRMGRSRRTLLIEGRPGSPANYERLRQALLSACRGLSLQDRMTTHRLRHTYATSLLAGGMSLLGVMKLLGHRDYRMTLRYTAISDETIAIEYDKALTRTLDQYQNPPLADPYTSSPLQLLDDVTRLIRRAAADFTLDPATAKAFQKRLRRLHASLDKALRTKSH